MRSKEKKKQDQFEFTTTMQKEKRGVVKLPVLCPDLVNLACILKIRGYKLLELTFREFHIHLEAMACAQSGCRGKTY